MEQTQDKSTKRNGADGKRAVSRSFSSAEEAREYMRSEGLDVEAEETFGREAIKKLKATVAKQKQEADPLWHPSCTRRVSDGMCNCG